MTREATERLRRTLSDLRAELDALDPIDSEERSMLGDAVADIQAKLHDAEAAYEPADEGEHEGFTAQLRDAEASFADSHPKLSAAVRGVLEALRQFGI